MFFQNPYKIRMVLGFVLLLRLGGTGQDTLDFVPSVELAEFSVIEVGAENLLTNYYKGNGMNLTENIMERLPSVSLIKRGNFAPEPVFRGFSSGQINLTIDGMHIFGACTDKMDPVSSYVESNNLKEIEAGCDVNSSSNGAGLGGAINLNGKIIYQSKLYYTQDQILIAVEGWTAGQYTCVLLADGQTILSKKITIIK